ncbi:MAG TPA: hypothetical protein VIY86_12325, partial [Pirellulaceae bacterium]
MPLALPVVGKWYFKKNLALAKPVALIEPVAIANATPASRPGGGSMSVGDTAYRVSGQFQRGRRLILSPASDGNHLCQDADGDFRYRYGPDLESN